MRSPLRVLTLLALEKWLVQIKHLAPCIELVCALNEFNPPVPLFCVCVSVDVALIAGENLRAHTHHHLCDVVRSIGRVWLSLTH